MTRTLELTVKSDEEFYEDVTAAIKTLKAGGTVDSNPTVSFPSQELLTEVITGTTLSLLRALSEHEPASIRETARLVDRDVKNVHGDLTRLEAMGIIVFEESGQAKRPVFPFDELVVTVPFPHDEGESESSEQTAT